VIESEKISGSPLKKLDRPEMSRMIQLSSNGLQRIPDPEIRKDFTFIVEGFPHCCSWHVAHFLSPKLCAQFSHDSTSDVFHIETAGAKEVFDNIILIGRGENFSLPGDDFRLYSLIFQELGNSEAISLIYQYSHVDFSISNAIEQFIYCIDFDFTCDTLISFIASHFWAFPTTSFNSLNDNGIALILSHRELKIASEESVFELVLSRIEHDLSSFHLLEFVEFQYLSTERISQFCTSDRDFFQYLTASVWSTLSRRLTQTPPKLTNPRLCRPPGISFVPDPDNPLSGGLISHLTRQCGRNLHEAGIVTATASSVYDTTTNYHAMRTLDLTTDSFVFTENQPGQWVCYDFHDMRIRPTHYAIRSRNDLARGNNHLRSWIFECRRDGGEWEQIDSRSDSQDLNDPGVRRLFSVTSSSEYRYFRLSQTGPNHSGNHCLGLSGFEIFGTLIK
jgi:hypothetical protein